MWVISDIALQQLVPQMVPVVQQSSGDKVLAYQIGEKFHYDGVTGKAGDFIVKGKDGFGVIQKRVLLAWKDYKPKKEEVKPNEDTSNQDIHI